MVFFLTWPQSFRVRWVHARAHRNSHVTRQQTADFLRVMPTLAAVNLAFNSVYNCMAFWFQDSTDSKTPGRYTDAAWWEPRMDCKSQIGTHHNITYYDLWTSDIYCNYNTNLIIYMHISHDSIYYHSIHIILISKSIRPFTSHFKMLPFRQRGRSRLAWWMCALDHGSSTARDMARNKSK